MIEEENPYAPPKSSDFRLPENEKPSKWRVFWWIFSLSFVLITIATLTPYSIIRFIFDKDEFYEFYGLFNEPFFILFVFVFLIIYFIPITVALFIIECLVKNIKEKIIYSFVIGVLIYFLMDFVGIIIFNEFPYENFIDIVSGIFELIGYMIAIYFIVKKVNYRILNYS